jgi:hypothetical protein
VSLTLPKKFWKVFLDDEEVDYLIPLEIIRTSGGQRLDFARFKYDLASTGEHVENLKTPAEWNKIVEVRFYETEQAAEDGSPHETLFWGHLGRQDLEVGKRESVEVIAVVRYHDIGRPIDGMWVYDVRNEEPVLLRGDVVFQPLIDGVIEDSMSVHSSDEHEDAQLWADPESHRTDEADTYAGGEPSEWVLSEALHSLTRFYGNPGGGFLSDPNVVRPPEVRGSEDIDDSVPFQNVRIPYGTPLAVALDMILHPLGYDWYINHPSVFVFEEPPELTVYRRGQGEEKTVTMQAWGQALDLDVTNLEEFSLSVDVNNRVNKVELLGSRKQWEIGFELYRGWDIADDALTAADLEKGNIASEYNTNNKHDPWRLWVANEAGDYSGTRSGGANSIPEEPRDWTEFGCLYDHRRFAEDCLTKGPDGQRLPPQVEWWNPDTSGWEPLPDDDPSWSYQILESQLGIRFNSNYPPHRLIAAGDSGKIRMTCTLTTDEPLRVVVASEGRDPEADEEGDVWFKRDVSDRYHYRQVNVIGDYQSFVWQSGEEKDERDDEEALTTLAEYVLAEEDGADMEGELRLPGIRTDYQIGDLITSINGRNINLNRRSELGGQNTDEEAAEPKYPQIVGIAYKLQGKPRTILAMTQQQIDPWFRPGSRPDGEFATKGAVNRAVL